MTIEATRIRQERSRLEHEWIKARADKAALQNEANKARRAGREDPTLRPTEERKARLKTAKVRCKALDRHMMSLMEMERLNGVGWAAGTGQDMVDQAVLDAARA